MQLCSPGSAEEAIELLVASAPPVDSFTHHRHRDREYLREGFGTGRRRPEWVWAIGDAAPLGIVSAQGFPSAGLYVLDVLAIPAAPEPADRLVAHATAALRALGTPEVNLFAPPDWRFDDPRLAPVASPFVNAGWRLLVQRRHYEFAPSGDLPGPEASSLTFVRPADGADPRLVECYREVMRDTLDAHDRALIADRGLDGAAREGLAHLLDANPVEAFHLACDGAGDVVGMVSGAVAPGRRGIVDFVGVAHDHRGRDYGRQIVSWQTHRLLEAGATTLVAETDDSNVPMAAAFAAAGWPQTETRLDLEL